MKQLIYSTIIGALLTAASYFIAIIMGWTSLQDISLLEAFAVLTSYSCTYLCVVQVRMNYPIGAISTIAYCILFVGQGLYASALLNAYLPCALIYGWFRWGRDETSRPVTSLLLTGKKYAMGYATVTLVMWLCVVGIVSSMGANLAFMDSGILCLSILAQFLLDNKRIETWIVWLIVDIIALQTYFDSGLYLVFLQYVLFTINTVIGFIAWWYSMKKNNALLKV